MIPEMFLLYNQERLVQGVEPRTRPGADFGLEVHEGVMRFILICDALISALQVFVLRQGGLP
jgi:hypothetical protein